MQTLLKLLACVCAWHVAGGVARAEEWRGLVPLRSTREDVVRLFGQCADPKARCSFSMGEEHVYIVFSSANAYVDCVKRLPPGVVMLVDVTLSKAVPLSEVKVDLSRFRKFESSNLGSLGSIGYIDEEAGVVYDTYKGKLAWVVYLAAQRDRHLCPAYYEKPEMFVSKIVEPPEVGVACPAEIAAGGRATLVGYIRGGDPEVTPAFEWDLSAGKIVSGQKTGAVVVEAPAPWREAQTIRATLKVGGYWDTIFEASCEMPVVREPKGK